LGKGYISWMNFALDFAYLNRRVMMQEVKAAFRDHFPDVEFITWSKVTGQAEYNMINIHHNYAALENHYGRNLWVHRKGATKASEGLVGIIPGSMGTPSYITKGLGNHLSLMSCSHGAGRTMSRKAYSRSMAGSPDVEASLDGIIHSEFKPFRHGRDKGLLDVSEAPGAYKDIDTVMANQSDLVEPLVKLRPLISVKG